MTDHVQECAISGKRLDPGDPVIQTKHGAYGVKANLLKELTDEKRAEIEARLFPSEVTNATGNDDANSISNAGKPKGGNRSSVPAGDGG